MFKVIKKCNDFYNQTLRFANTLYSISQAISKLLFGNENEFGGIRGDDEFKLWLTQLENFSYPSGYVRFNIVDGVIVHIDSYKNGGEAYVISLSKDNVKKYIDSESSDSKYFSYKEEHIIPAKGRIPKMYYAVLDFYNTLNKEDSNYATMFSLFKEAFDFMYLSINEKQIIDGIKNNISKINLINSFIKEKPSFLGAGADGVAYNIGDNLVLKFFTSSFPNEKIKESLDSLWSKNPIARSEIMIYDHGEMDFNGQTIYYSIMPKLDKIDYDDDIHKIYFTIGELIMNLDNYGDLDNINNNLNNPNVMDLIKLIVNKIEIEVLNMFSEDFVNQIQKDNNFVSTWLAEYIEEVLVKFLTGRGDLHMGNIGIIDLNLKGIGAGESGRRLRYFDPSHENHEGKINIGN